MTLVLLLLTIASIVVGVEVYARLIVPGPPLNFDEAAHSLPGYYMLRDLRNLDARAFWADFHIQTLWPPMFSMLQAPVLGVLGHSDESARLFAYIALACAALPGAVVARAIAPDLAPLAALIGGLLALSAPGWLFVGSWAMQETPVALMAFATCAVYLTALRRASLGWHVASGLMLIGLFLTKYNYAAFALAAIGAVDVLTRLRRALRAKRARDFGVASFVALYGVVALGVLGWFFTGIDVAPTAVKWRDFAFFVSNENSGLPFWSADNLLFYVRASADWLMPHPLLFAATLLAAGYAVWRVREPGVYVLAIFFALGFVLATVHPLKSNRYITPIYPSLWLLSGIGVAAWALRPMHAARARAAVIGIIAIALASWVTWLPRLQPAWAGASARDMRAAGDQIVRWQDSARPVLIIGTFGEMGPPYFEWRLRPLPAFANSPLPVNYDAPPVEGDDDIARVRRWLSDNPGAQVTLIDVDEASPMFNTNDMQQKSLWKQKIVDRFGEIDTHRQIETVDYPDSGLRISYFLPK
jgi:4-amino-4-deoxy-L-arabinose transferase-like glycosyltransferase